MALYSPLLAGLHVLLTLPWSAMLIAVTAPLGYPLRKPSAIRTLDRLTGGVFVAFRVKLAISSAH